MCLACAGQAAYVVTFGRAGEDNKKFKLGDVEQTLAGFAGADYDLQARPRPGRVRAHSREETLWGGCEEHRAEGCAERLRKGATSMCQEGCEKSLRPVSGRVAVQPCGNACEGGWLELPQGWRQSARREGGVTDEGAGLRARSAAPSTFRSMLAQPTGPILP